MNILFLIHFPFLYAKNLLYAKTGKFVDLSGIPKVFKKQICYGLMRTLFLKSDTMFMICGVRSPANKKPHFGRMGTDIEKRLSDFRRKSERKF